MADIKELFRTQQILAKEDSKKTVSEVESFEYISEKVKNDQVFIPEIDFSDPKNFAKFGSAAEYYEKSFDYISATYPFDGSNKEILQWKKDLLPLERYIFDNVYPKSTGYLQLNGDTYLLSPSYVNGFAVSDSGQYIKVFSGPNQKDYTYDKSQERTKDQIYKQGNILDKNIGREANLALSPDTGNTVELWFNFNRNYQPDQTEPDVVFSIFDLSNGKNYTDTVNYLRYLIEFNHYENKFYLTYKYGSNGVSRQPFDIQINFDDSWNHIAFSVINKGSELSIKYYINGLLEEEILCGTAISATVNNFNNFAHIGSYASNPLEQASQAFNLNKIVGAIPAKIDEFKFWKTERSEKDIFRERLERSYGGTNTDLANVDLGLYFRFNEGVIDDSTVNQYDSRVLDSSGRFSDGDIINYRVSALAPLSGTPEYFKVRSLGSAINESGIFEHSEPEEPIINPLNSTYISIKNSLIESGSLWDDKNHLSLYNSLPNWISEQDGVEGTEQLKSLTQIVSSYFDKLYLEAGSIQKTTFAEYSSGTEKPAPFMNSILNSYGLDVDDLFIDSSILENLRNRNENLLYDNSLSEIKNLIYENINNNLIYLYKSKGTEKAYRNLIRCFGVDDELIKINLYSNNTKYSLQNNKKSTVSKNKVLNLCDKEGTRASLVLKQSNPLQPTLGGISTNPYFAIPFTYEVEAYFPKKLDIDNPYYYVPEEKNISLFGIYSLDNNIPKYSNSFGFEVFLDKNDINDVGGHFRLYSYIHQKSYTCPDYISNIYSNEKWNFALRLKYPEIDISQFANNKNNFYTALAAKEIKFELYAVSTAAGEKVREIIIETDAVPLADIEQLHKEYKSIYVGAKRNELRGSLLNYTDAQFIKVLFSYDYITNEEVLEHALDSLNYGTLEPANKPYLSLGDITERNQLLALYLQFDDIKSTDENAELNILDSKSNSVGDASYFLSNINASRDAEVIEINKQNYTDIVKDLYYTSVQPQLPENLYSTNTISLEETDTIFTRETRPSSFLISFEKSLYQVISEDMLNMFSGIKDFNNLIGEPINKYRQEYRDITHLRELFFSKVQESATVEKFIEYYKWFDSAIGNILNQFSPGSTETSKNLRNVIESHALERPKHVHTLGAFKKKNQDLDIGIAKSIKELKYDWRIGHAPINQISQDGSELWFKERAERELPSDSSYISREKILEVATTDTKVNPKIVYDNFNSKKYKRPDYSLRRLTGLYQLDNETYHKVSEYNKLLQYSDRIDIFDTSNRQEKNILEREVRELFAPSDKSRSSLYALGTKNYFKEYEIINGLSSDINSKILVGNTVPTVNNIQLSNYDKNVENVVDTKHKAIFRTQFSSPAREIKSLFDPIRKSFNVSATINERSKQARADLDKDSSKTFDINNIAQTLHKVNKNRLANKQRVDSSNLEYDNNFVQHQIPRTDYGYAWIANASSSSLENETGGPYSSNYKNLDIAGLEIFSASYESGEFIDFAGTNAVVVKNINVEGNLISPVDADGLHKYILNNGGIYGYSTLKQVRNWDKLLLSNARKVNKYYVGTKTYIEPGVSWNTPAYVKGKIAETITYEYLPPMTIKAEYLNDSDSISNKNMALDLGLTKKQLVDTPYGKIKSLGRLNYENEILDNTNKKLKFYEIGNSQLAWPKKDSIGLGVRRNKPSYNNNSYTGSITDVSPYSSAQYLYNRRPSKVDGIFGYATSSYNNIPFSIGNIRTAIVHSIFDGIYESNLALDNKYTGVFSVELPLNNGAFTATVNKPAAQVGQLTPFKEEEAAYLLKVANGSLQTPSPLVKFFNYSSQERKLPRPQLFFNNSLPIHFGPVTLSRSRGGTLDARSYILSINNGYTYEINDISNKISFYESYNKFNEDIKPLTKNLSILPEFKIDNLMEYYIENNLDYTIAPTSSYLSIHGTDGLGDISLPSNTFNKTDAIDLSIYDDNLSDLKKNYIEFNIKAILKFLPQRGFYVSDRISEISKKFINSFKKIKDFKYIDDLGVEHTYDSDYSPPNKSNGTPIDQQIASIIQPLFAPGILLNTIKSSIAVDWPIMLSNNVIYQNSTVPDFYNTASADADDESSYVINKKFTARLPFEALLKPDRYLNNISANLNYLDPTHYSSQYLGGATRAYPSVRLTSMKDVSLYLNEDYKLAINNLLAEIPNFYLASRGLTNFRSGRESDFLPVEANKTYSMYVSLENNNIVQYKGDFYDELARKELLTIDGDIKAAKNDYYYGLPVESIYGPPTRYFEKITSSIGSDSQRHIERLFMPPAFAPYLPSYYNGKATAKLSYTPTISGKPSLIDILNNLKIEYTNSELDDLFLSSSNICVSSSDAKYNSNYTNSPAYLSRMPLESSLNIKQIFNSDIVVKDSNGNIITTTTVNPLGTNGVWSIQTKYETPVIDFSNISNFGNETFLTSSGYITGLVVNEFKGLWTTYGALPSKDNGIKLSIEDRDSDTEHSLLKICRFKEETKKIGVVGHNFISEGIVMIPYTYDKNHGLDGFPESAVTQDPDSSIEVDSVDAKNLSTTNYKGPYYFKVDEAAINNLLGIDYRKSNFDTILNAIKNIPNSNTNSIVRTMKYMVDYNIPPHLNWLLNKNIKPFVMYIDDFSISLDAAEMTDLWQGVIPDELTKTKKRSSVIGHEMSADNFFHGKQLRGQIYFKLFKVKKKAKINYYDLTDDMQDSKENGDSFYGYNWPYDHFSLVEAANMSVKIISRE